MSKDNPLSDHEMALFLIKDQVRVLTSLENYIQILKAFVKTLSIDQKSSMKTSMMFSIKSEKIAIIHR